MAGGVAQGIQAGGAIGGPWGAAAGGVLGLLGDSFGGGSAPSGPIVSGVNNQGAQTGFLDGSNWAVNFGSGAQTTSATSGNQGGSRPASMLDSGQPLFAGGGGGSIGGMSINTIVMIVLAVVIVAKLAK